MQTSCPRRTILHRRQYMYMQVQVQRCPPTKDEGPLVVGGGWLQHGVDRSRVESTTYTTYVEIWLAGYSRAPQIPWLQITDYRGRQITLVVGWL